MKTFIVALNNRTSGKMFKVHAISCKHSIGGHKPGEYKHTYEIHGETVKEAVLLNLKDSGMDKNGWKPSDYSISPCVDRS